jgi:hypothetical protein
MELVLELFTSVIEWIGLSSRDSRKLADHRDRIDLDQVAWGHHRYPDHWD